MNILVQQKGAVKYIECLPGGQTITGEREALDLIGACAEHETDRLLIHSECLAPEFFQLRTGVAGQILLKFAIYHMRVAAVIPPEVAQQGRFGEMVLETNRGNEFRVYPTRDLAEAWLVEE